MDDLKIKKKSTADLVCEKMKSMISNGTWQYYQKIPSESDLAEMFGVNRLTVRIALQRLNALGILDTRVGDGTYVCHFDLGQHIKDVSEFYMTPKLLEDVSEFRRVFEIECARLAIQKRTDEDLRQLKERCLQYEQANAAYFRLLEAEGPQSPALKAACDRLDHADIAFHEQICAMSHNDLLVYAFAVAKPAILEQIVQNSKIRLPFLVADQGAGSVRGHWDIYHAIEQRDPDACQAYYLAMIDPHNATPYTKDET